MRMRPLELIVERAPLPDDAFDDLGRDAPRSEAGVVSQRLPETTDADCRFRLVVTSAPAEGGAVPHPFDECVDRAVWAQAGVGGPVTLKLLGSALGAELVGVAAR